MVITTVSKLSSKRLFYFLNASANTKVSILVPNILTQNKSTSSTSLINNNEVKTIEKHETSTLAAQTNDFEKTELKEVFKPKVPVRKSIFTKTAKVDSSDENSSLRNQKQDNVKLKISQSTLGNRSITR